MIQKGINQMLGIGAGLAVSTKSAVNKANVTMAKGKGVMVDNPALAKNKKVPNISSNQSILEARKTGQMLQGISPQQARANFVKLGQIQVQQRLSFKQFKEQLAQHYPGLGKDALDYVAKSIPTKERKKTLESLKGVK